MSDQTPLPDSFPKDAVVIRGGRTLTYEHLVTAMTTHHDMHGAYRLSMNCVPGLPVDALGKKAALKNRTVSVTMVEAIEGAGFMIKPSTDGSWQTKGHCDVWYADGDSELPPPEALECLAEAFAAPILNPANPPQGGKAT